MGYSNLIHYRGKPAFRVLNAPQDTDYGVVAGVDFVIRFDSQPRYKWQKVDERGTVHDAYDPNTANGDGLTILTPSKFRLKLVIEWGVIRVGDVAGNVLQLTDYATAPFAGSEYEFLQYLDNHKEAFGGDGLSKLWFRMNHQRPLPLIEDDAEEWVWAGQDTAYEIVLLDFTPDSAPRPGIDFMTASIQIKTKTLFDKFPATFSPNRTAY